MSKLTVNLTEIYGTTYFGLKIMRVNGVSYSPDKRLAICGGSYIESAVIPHGVVEIGESAFEKCKFLKSVIISDTVKKIGSLAFADCTSLETVLILDSNIEINKEAFSGCTSLKSLIIPENLFQQLADSEKNEKESNSNEKKAFEVFELNFEGISNLAKVFPLRQEISTRILLSNPNIVIQDGFAIDGNILLCPLWKMESAIIPSSITKIGKDAFCACKFLKNIVIPNSVRIIGDEAFFLCTSLKSLDIPSSVIKVGARAFGCCKSLESIVVHGAFKADDDPFSSSWLSFLPNSRNPQLKIVTPEGEMTEEEFLSWNSLEYKKIRLLLPK